MLLLQLVERTLGEEIRGNLLLMGPGSGVSEQQELERLGPSVRQRFLCDHSKMMEPDQEMGEEGWHTTVLRDNTSSTLLWGPLHWVISLVAVSHLREELRL